MSEEQSKLISSLKYNKKVNRLQFQRKSNHFSPLNWSLHQVLKIVNTHVKILLALKCECKKGENDIKKYKEKPANMSSNVLLEDLNKLFYNFSSTLLDRIRCNLIG